jgi:iron-sulfur cluster assembly protein
METINKTPVTLTDGATTEIKRLMGQESFDKKRFLRVGVKGGGCSGMSYILDFEEKTADDEYFEIDGIPCIINPAQSIYLVDMRSILKVD